MPSTISQTSVTRPKTPRRNRTKRMPKGGSHHWVTAIFSPASKAWLWWCQDGGEWEEKHGQSEEKHRPSDRFGSHPAGFRAHGPHDFGRPINSNAVAGGRDRTASRHTCSPYGYRRNARYGCRGSR